MKKILVSLVYIVFGISLIDGQTSNTRPSSTIKSEREKARDYWDRGIGDWDRAKAEYFNTLQLRNPGKTQSELLKVFQQSIKPLYRDLTDAEKEILLPSREDIDEYSDFLRKNDTGIIKLMVDRGCADNPAIVNVSAECLKYSMPGAGSSFSFRVNNYRIKRLADLTFTNNEFQTAGKLMHGILVNVGNVDLNKISLEMNSVKFLNNFEVSSEIEKAAEIERQLISGVEKNGISYRNNVKMQLNSTYLLRSVAYRGSFLRAVQNVVYDEFDFDKRRDITVAFRVIGQDKDGNITIIWKKLRNTKSPEIIRDRKKNSDIDESKFVAKTKVK